MINNQLKYIIGFLFLVISIQAKSQCEINVQAFPEEVYCGQPVNLVVFGSGVTEVVLEENFNSSGFGSGWSSTPNAVDFSNPCSSGGVDGTPHAWMGNNTSVPRDIVSNAYDISGATAGVTICFDLLFATQAQSSPCEGPDESDEGVYLQYSTDGGGNWVTIHYFDPNGGHDPTLTNWNNWCFELPVAAITPNTMFRWHQSADSGADYDHWGIDNVSILQNDADQIITWGNSGDDYYYEYGAGSPGGDNPNNPIVPTETTTYTATLVNTYGDECSASVTVTVLDPVYDIDLNVNPSPVCLGSCATISGTVAQLLDEGGITTWANTQPESISQDPFGGSETSVNINVQGVYSDVITPGMIQTICIDYFDFFGIASGGSLDISSFEYTLVTPDGCEIILIPSGTLTVPQNPFPFPIPGFDPVMEDVCFEMGGATDLSSQDAPYTGTYQPAEPFDNLVGCDPNGVWSIVISAPSQGVGGGSGTFEGWNITLDNPPLYDSVNYSFNPTDFLSDPTGSNVNHINTQVCPDENITYEITFSNWLPECGSIIETIDIVVDPNCSCTPPNIVTTPLVGCDVDLSDAIDPSSDAANLSYHGSQGDALADINPITGNVNTTGSYWVRAVDPSDPTCYWAYEITVTVPIITYQTTNTNPACGQLDGEINLTASDGTSPYTYSIDGGATSQGNGNFTNLGAGTYNIFIVDALGCEVTGTENLSNVGGVTIDDVQAQDPSCSNDDGTISITVSGGTSYDFQWEDALGNTLGSITNTIGNLPAGTYTVVVTDDAGCTATEVITLNPPSGADDASFDFADFCEGAPNGPTNIVTPGGTFSFNPLPTDNATIDPSTGEISDATTGATYTVEYTTSGGCPATETVTVSVGMGANISVSTIDPSCGNADGEITITATGGSAPYQFSIDNGATFVPNNVFDQLNTGSYTVQVMDNGGCISEQIVSLSNIDGPVIDNIQTIQSSCSGNTGEIIIQASGGTGTIQYSIDGGNTFQATSAYTGLAAGDYTIVIQDGAGCQTTSTISVGAANPPVLSIDDFSDVSCFGANDGSISLLVTGGTPTFAFAWQPNVSSSETASNLSPGTYTITVTDGLNCTDQITVTIQEPDEVVIQAEVVGTTCGLDDGSISLDVSGGTGSYSYTWDGNVSSTEIADNLAEGIYNVIVTDANGCSANYSGEVLIDESFTIDISPDDAYIQQGESINLDLYIDPNVDIDTIIWTPTEGISCSNCDNPTASPEETTTYFVGVIDVNGCVSTDSITIVVEPPCGEVFVPNIFSPNADGTNDFACVFGSCVVTMEFSIFNRWGEEVFYSEDQKDCWNGMHRGKRVQSGVYTYILRGTLKGGEEIKESGSITVVN